MQHSLARDFYNPVVNSSILMEHLLMKVKKHMTASVMGSILATGGSANTTSEPFYILVSTLSK